MVMVRERPAGLVVDLLPKGNLLRITFPFDPRMVALVKTIPGRRYHPEGRYWTVPSFAMRELQSAAARANIPVLASSQTRQALEQGLVQRQQLLETKTLQDAALVLPTTTSLYPYQRAGVAFLLRSLTAFKGALLADDMGLGKTVQALSVPAISEGLKQVLVLCPASLKYVWAAELDKHYPQLSYQIIEGSPGERARAWAAPARVKIANYELLLRDKLAQVKNWDMVICDEATRIKNYKTKTARAVKQLRRRYSLALSGAPIENRLEELHSIFDFVMPGLLGPGWRFVVEHCIRTPWGKVVGYRGMDKIRERIGPHYLRRTKGQVLTELPPKVYNDVPVELSRAEWRVYEAILEQIRSVVAENPKIRAVNVLTEMLRLKQCTGDIRLLGEDIGHLSTKLQALADILEAAEGHKVVAFTQFAQLALLVQKDLDAAIIYGAQPAKERAGIIESFQREGGRQLLVSTEAGAYGVTLTAADIVVHIDQPWNPARLRQREDRLHRIGQVSSVQVVNLLARRTIDEHVVEIIHRKRELTRALFEDDEALVQTLTREDLLSLLSG